MTKNGRKRSRPPARAEKKDRKVLWVALGAAILAGLLIFWMSAPDEDLGGARTLTPVSSAPDVHGMAVDPEDPSRLYVATHHGLIRAVGDTDWARVGTMQDDLMGFSMHPSEGGTFWVSGHPRGGGNMGVRMSTDGGFTWETLALKGEVDFHAMAVSPADPDVLWGSFRGKVYHSTDGGHDWDTVGDAPSRTAALVGDPDDRDTVYAATSEGILQSTSGGTFWEPFVSLPATSLQFAAEEGVLYAGGPGGVQKSTDGGESWERAGSDFDGGTVGYLAAHPTDADILYAATYQAGIYKTADGGGTWVRILDPSR